MYFMSDPQALHVTRNVIPGKLGVDLHLHRVHIPLVISSDRRIWRYQLLNYLLLDRRSECKLGKIDSVRSVRVGFGLCSSSYDLLTYLPHPNPCFALGSRLDRQWSPLHGYRPFINPIPMPTKITCIYNTMLNFNSVSFCTAYIIFTFRARD